MIDFLQSTIRQAGAIALTYYRQGVITSEKSNGMDHDLVGPILICQEAGAVVTNHRGQPWQPGQQDVVIANANLHPKLLKLFDN